MAFQVKKAKAYSPYHNKSHNIFVLATWAFLWKYYTLKNNTLANYLVIISMNILLKFQTFICDISRENPKFPKKFDGFYYVMDKKSIKSIPKIIS